MIKKTLERTREINCIFNHSRCEYSLLELIFGSRDLKGGSLFFTPFIGTFVRLCSLQSLSFAPSKLHRKIGGSWGDYLATKFLALQGSVLVDSCHPPADACPSLCSMNLSLLPCSNWWGDPFEFRSQIVKVKTLLHELHTISCLLGCSNGKLVQLRSKKKMKQQNISIAGRQNIRPTWASSNRVILGFVPTSCVERPHVTVELVNKNKKAKFSTSKKQVRALLSCL